MLWSAPDDYVACISRQRGKSWWALVECIGVALRKPKQLIKYAGKTQPAIMDIILPTLEEILEESPIKLRPKLDKVRLVFKWEHNGSEMKLAGTDNKHYENLRGGKSNFNVKDESAFFDDYWEVDAVMSPMQLTTGGITLEISTPPETPDHPFTSNYNFALARGRSMHRTIYGHPRMTPEQIDAYIAKEAGKKGMGIEEFKGTTYFRREFLAEFVTEESRAAIPGWTAERAQRLIRKVERPKHYDAYASGDWGFVDGHGILWGWWDFDNQTLVIEGEVLLKETNTESLATAAKAMEVKLYGEGRFDGTLRGAKDFPDLPKWLEKAINDKAPKQPLLRVGDDNPLVLADMHQKHGLTFCPTRKDNKYLAVDELDIMVRREKVVISPECPQLIKQLFGTLWNKQRTQWERTTNGHGELIDCATYMVRNINRHKDPRPKPIDQWGINTKPGTAEALRQAFSVRR